MGDVEKFIKNVEVISSSFGKVVEYFANDILVDGVKDWILHQHNHRMLRRNQITTPSNRHLIDDLFVLVQELNQFKGFVLKMKSESAKIDSDLQNGCHVRLCNHPKKDSASFVKDISSFDNLDRQVPSKLIKFIVHVEKFISDIENITTSFGKGPLKRKKTSKHFLDKIKQYLRQPNANSPSLFDLFKSGNATSNETLTSQKNNLFAETVNFLKDEIEEIESVRNILKAEDERMNKLRASEAKEKEKSEKPVIVNLVETDNGYEMFNSPGEQENGNTANNNSENKDDKKSAPFLEELSEAEAAVNKAPISEEKGEKGVGQKAPVAAPVVETKEKGKATVIPIESTMANPDEAKKEAEYSLGAHKVPGVNKGTVFTPIEFTEEEEEKMKVPEESAKLKDDKSENVAMKKDVTMHVKRKEGSSAVMEKELDSLDKNITEVHDDIDVHNSSSQVTTSFDNDNKTVNNQTESDMSAPLSPTSNTTAETKDEVAPENGMNLPLENIVEKYERTNKNSNGTEIVLTPKMFKETINEAIMQFARRINLANTVMDPQNSTGFGNRIIKEAAKQENRQLGDAEVSDQHNASTSRDMIQNFLSNYTDELQNNTLICHNETEECQNQTNSLEAAGQTSDVLRLFEFFSKNKQEAPVNLHYDTNNQLIVDITPNTNLVEGDPVRKSIFGENSATTDAYGTPHLASATHYMPASSYLNYLTEARKKSIAMHSAPKLSAATPYHDEDGSSMKNNAVKDYITHMNETEDQKNTTSAVDGNVSVVPDSTESKKENLNPSDNKITTNSSLDKSSQDQPLASISSDSDLNSTLNATLLQPENTMPQDSPLTSAKTENSSSKVPDSTKSLDTQKLKKAELTAESAAQTPSTPDELKPIVEPHETVKMAIDNSSSVSNSTLTGSSSPELNKLPADKQPLLAAFIKSLREQASSPSSVAIINTSDLQKATSSSTSSPEQALAQTAAIIENIPDLGQQKESIESTTMILNKGSVACPNGDCTTKDKAVTRTFYPPNPFKGPLLNNGQVRNLSSENQQHKPLPIANKIVHSKNLTVDKTKKGKQYYCQDRPCFSLKDIWKMLHCDHPPCFRNIFAQSKPQGVVKNVATKQTVTANSKPTTKVYGNNPLQTWSQLPVQNGKLAREYAHIQTQTSYNLFENPQSFLEKKECACLKATPTDTKCEERCITGLKRELAALQKTEVAKPNPVMKMPQVIKTKSPVIIMLNPNVKGKVEFPDKRTQKRKNASKICSSWTYYPAFRCLHEYPTYSPIHKPKGAPFDGPYENCRSMQYPPYFKCFSNPLQLDAADQQRKITEDNKDPTKMQSLFDTIKKKLKVPQKESNDITKNPVMTSFNEFLMSVPKKKNLLEISSPKKGPAPSSNSKAAKINQKVKKPSSSVRNNPSVVQKQKVQPAKMMSYPPLADPMKAGLMPSPYNYYTTYPGPYFYVPYKSPIVPTLSAKSKQPVAKKVPPVQKSANVQSSSLLNGQTAPKAPPMHTEAIAKILMGQNKPGVSLATRAKQMLSHQQAWNKMPKTQDMKSKKSESNVTNGQPYSRSQFSTYVNTLLSEKKVEEADLFKKILNVIMASPKSQKYNEAGGDPWQYIFPALKWIEEYETVWKPKYKSEKNKSELKAHEKEKIKKPLHISNDDIFALFEQKIKKPPATKEKPNRKVVKIRPSIKISSNVRQRKKGNSVVKGNRVLNSSKNVARASRKIPSIFKTNKVSRSNEKVSSILRAIKALHPDMKISNASSDRKSLHGAIVVDIKSSTKKVLPLKSKPLVHSNVGKTVDKKSSTVKSRLDKKEDFARPNMSKELIKDTLYETSSLLNDLVDEEEIHSLGFTTANTTNILSAKLL